MTVLRFNVTVQFGHGLRSGLGEALAGLGVRRALVVTDRGVIAAGVLAMALEAVPPGAVAATFDATPPNPTEAAAYAGLAAYRDGGCDGIVAVGGGAALDLAKAIAVLVGDEAPLWEYCNRHPRPRPVRGTPPLVVLPTTVGSGSETGRSAVIVFANGIKAGIGCPSVVSLAICDPELTLSLPPGMTAATGMDAMSHCIETFCAPPVNPPADAVVLDGLRRLWAQIERATAEGRDRDARWDMMMGSTEGAIGFQKGLGAVHALSHPLGAMGLHHGTLNAVLLPHVLARNAGALSAKLPILRDAMGLPPGADVAEAVAALNRRLGLPAGLGAMGVGQDALPGVAAAAMEDNAHRTNPVRLDAGDYLALLRAAF